MLQVARLAPNVLGEAADLVRQFLRSLQNPAGGFNDRAGNPDLYYTVFAVEGLIALRDDPPVDALLPYLRSFAAGASLDFVHVACLARAWASMPGNILEDDVRQAILSRVESHRTPDGGYEASHNAKHGTLYGCFLAWGAYQDLGQDLPNPESLIGCIQSLRADDGGYSNQRDVPMGLTPSTAAAATLLRQLQQPLPQALGEWLLARCRPEGGFFATPLAPLPDLLSTATALHALAGMQADFSRFKEPCLDFIDTLWSSQGGFYGTWEDDILDCEYTFYALLALGHLSL
jgi:prenyltransferase beta subunit